MVALAPVATRATNNGGIALWRINLLRLGYLIMAGGMGSIIVPAFNEVEAADEIVEFYRQVRVAHPAHAFELIVVDDGSTDGTAQAVAAAVSEGVSKGVL